MTMEEKQKKWSDVVKDFILCNAKILKWERDIIGVNDNQHFVRAKKRLWLKAERQDRKKGIAVVEARVVLKPTWKLNGKKNLPYQWHERG